jgi:hypothetical protein
LAVTWNIGAIATSKDPRALDIIRRLLLVSAAIPGAFPPTMIDVTVDGVPYQEMHVDGGAFLQAFLYPCSITKDRRERIEQGKSVPEIDAYIIRNARLDPDWSSVRRRTLGIAGRAIATMKMTTSSTILPISARISPRNFLPRSTLATCWTYSTTDSSAPGMATTGRNSRRASGSALVEPAIYITPNRLNPSRLVNDTIRIYVGRVSISLGSRCPASRRAGLLAVGGGASSRHGPWQARDPRRSAHGSAPAQIHPGRLGW